MNTQRFFETKPVSRAVLLATVLSLASLVPASAVFSDEGAGLLIDGGCDIPVVVVTTAGDGNDQCTGPGACSDVDLLIITVEGDRNNICNGSGAVCSNNLLTIVTVHGSDNQICVGSDCDDDGDPLPAPSGDVPDPIVSTVVGNDNEVFCDGSDGGGGTLDAGSAA